MDRRLTAILAADVVGYSRLMGQDEAATLAALKDHRRDIIDPRIASHHGRIFKLVGDGILAEFQSVVNAVACAADIQRSMAERNEGVPDDRRFVLRIGINLGDVIVEGDDIFGDGVNVAARLEGVAKPGGIAVSASVRDQVGERLGFTFEDVGEHQLKNIARPLRVFHVRWDTPSAAANASAPVSPQPPQPLAIPIKPSIAVLPFTNMSGDPEQEYFADGLVEDLITNLSKMPGLFVIARNSSFTYKGKATDIRTVARELGVRYVLEGSVRRAANRIRITGQLIEGTGATHVWADKFEGSVEDIFDLQDRLTASIVGAIEPSLRKAEIDRALRKRPDMLDAYDLYLRALPFAYANTIPTTGEAIRLLNEALRIDANYAAAHSFVAWCHEQRFFRAGFHPEDRASALQHAATALTLGHDDPQVLSIAAFVQANISHEYDDAIRLLDRSLEMNPNSALALGFSALVASFSERYERAVEHSQRALRLSPFDPLNYHPYLALGMSFLATGRPAEAVDNMLLAVQTNPSFSVLHAFLVAAQAIDGQDEPARASGRRLMEIAPDFTIAAFLRADFLGQTRMRSLAEGLRRAGLPE